ncbi:MAG: flavin reductase family protein [Sphingomonas sp.]|jgi:flavin reductase (DIM6/NTAB) family NADH-FMN oxidoreductase RutF
MKKHHFYEPARGHGLAHDPLSSIVAPRPIGWISTLSAAGVPNIAPYSFFNLFNYAPPIIGFSTIGWKDSAANIAETGEFVWNLVTRDLAEAMNTSSAAVAADVDEFLLAGIEGAPSVLVAPPRVAASPVAFECRHSQTLQLKSATGVETDSWLILGEVIGIHIDDAMIVDGSFNTARTGLVLRGGGWGDYFELGERFKMKRPG